MRKILQYIAFLLVIALISIPGVQMSLNLFKEKPLNGAFVLAEKPDFSKQEWDSGNYQDRVEKYLKDHAGFRNFLVRLYNQVDYIIYRKANAEGATIGKKRQLFEYDYIRSWLAIDNPGESFITKKLNRAKYVQEYLNREKGIDLVIVFEPGKASFYPEYIPEKYKKKKFGSSTYELFVQKAREIGVDFIDWQAYFMELKPGSAYPLFPKYGTHWSVYGMKFAADSMIRFIEKRRGIELAEVYADKIETSRIPRDTDDDVAKTMNLLIQPQGEELAYPVFSFDTVSQADKPMVLAVADSYYWNIFNTRIPKYLFANEAFWYFNARVYPDYYVKPLRTEELDLKSEVEKQDVIFLMITERFLYKFDWTFIDKLYKLYTPGFLQDPVYDNINRIMQHGPWFSDVIEKARKNGITFEEALILDARYLYNMDDTAAFMVRFGPQYFHRMITGSPHWMAGIRDKARSRGLAEEEMLEEDVFYTFQQKYPGYFELNHAISKKEAEIKSNPVLLDSVSRMAKYYRFGLDDLIWIIAQQSYREEEIKRISNAILRDEKWLKDVQRKALERNITLDEMVRMDATYVFELKLK